MQRRATAIFLVTVLAGLALLLATRVDLSGPLTGPGDAGIWKHTSFYVRQHLEFAPWPRLSLFNDDALYPYGTNQVFQNWAFERDVLVAMLSALYDRGPWLQLYYVFSLLVTALGCYALLRKDYGALRAGAVGWLVTFLNVYAIHKYPAHLGYAIVHWSILSLVTDFLIVRNVVERKPVSLTFILLRLALTSLSLGQDLGYIAGISLTSLTLSAVFCACVLVLRHRTALLRAAKEWLGTARAEARAVPVRTATLTVVWLTAGVLYIPLALQIARAANSYDFSGVEDGFWYANQWRLLLPYFPFLHPDHHPFARFFTDELEGFGAGAAGWTFVLPGLLGAWYGRKKLLSYVPLLVFFALCWLQLPEFRTLQIFPWSTFNRVATRMTIIYPVVLSLLALNIPFDLSKWRHRVAMALLVVIAGAEVFTVHSIRPEATYEYDADFYTYMNRVRVQPGEAILDWPFCMTGGNGIGAAQGLCPYYDYDRAIFALRIFHRKKVVGQYFGRLHITQIAPFLKDGWDKLLAPQKSESELIAHCFDEAEWRKFRDFFMLHEFAGIQLHTKFLTPDCVKQFHARFGEPTEYMTLPDTGETQFIPKRE